ncbi:thioesterase II family protein [Amycolatopsis nivea]
MATGSSTTPGGWFARAAARPAARARIYAFPHAGAGPGALAALAEALPDTAELWALNLPGRQARLEEPPRTELEPLVAELAADVLEDGWRQPRIFFGYCGGALLAYLTALRVAPDRLCVGSFGAPDVALVPRRLHALPDETFWDVVIEQGGVPPELAREELRPVFEAALRADFALYASCFPGPAAPLDVPVTVLRGIRDEELSLGSVLGWRRYSTRPLELRSVDAGHWLVDEAPEPVGACLAECVETDLSLRAVAR